MEVMSQPQRQRPNFTKRIHSELTGLEMYHTPHGQPCTVRFRWCLVNFVTEHRYIGGGKSRTVEHIDELDRQPCTVRHRCCPAVFRTETACRGAIRRLLAQVLSPLLQRYDDDDDAESTDDWDEFVPAGLAERIVAGAAAGGWGSYACDVSMNVEVTRVYSEAEELLSICEAAAAAAAAPADPAPPPPPSAGGDACPICMEELADGGTRLTACPHAFHRGCILQWFRKAPTCPCCRRDMSHYLGPSRQRLGHVRDTAMASVAEAAIRGLEAILSEYAPVARQNSSAVPTDRAIRHNRRQHRAAPYSAQEQHVARTEREHLLVAVRFVRDDAPDEPVDNIPFSLL